MRVSTGAFAAVRSARAGAKTQCDLIQRDIPASVEGHLPERALALLAEPSVIASSATISAFVKGHMPERVFALLHVHPRIRVEPQLARALALLAELHLFPTRPLSPSLPPGGDRPPEHPMLNQERGGWHPESRCPPLDSHTPIVLQRVGWIYLHLALPPPLPVLGVCFLIFVET